jgi:hypothetical protein
VSMGVMKSKGNVDRIRWLIVRQGGKTSKMF